MFVLKSGCNYLGIVSNNKPTSVLSKKNALEFDCKEKAENYKKNLKKTLKKFDWEVIEIPNDIQIKNKDNAEEGIEKQQKTILENDGFNIIDFFQNTISTMSQLEQYARNMNELEKEYNKKIKDTRHYKRDKKVKLNAIQLQRLAKFEIQLERERYECKSNRVIAEIFLNDIGRIENIDYIKVIKSVKESEYNPEILTYEILDEIVGKTNS